MSFFVKAAVILSCPSLALTAHCTTGSCLNNHDEVSFVQVKQAVTVKRKKKAAPAQPSVVDEAVNSLDGGTVIDAYENNRERVKPLLPESTHDELASEQLVYENRRINRQQAENKVAADRRALGEAIEMDKADVRAVADHRQAIENAVGANIQEAKANALANAITEKQVRDADIAGRLQGAREGEDEASREVRNANEEWENRQKAQKVEAAKEAEEEHRAHIQDIIADATARLKAEGDAWAASVDKNTNAAMAHAKAEAHEDEAAIEGPGGIKNEIAEDNGDRVVKHYSRESGRAEREIDATVSGRTG